MRTIKKEDLTLGNKVDLEFKNALPKELSNEPLGQDIRSGGISEDEDGDGIPDRLDINDKDVSGSDNKDLCDELTVSSEKELRSKMKGMNIPKEDKVKIEKEIDDMNKYMKAWDSDLDVANTYLRRIQNMLCTFSKEDKKNIDEDEIEENTGAGSAGAYVSNFGAIRKPLFKSNVMGQLTKESLLNSLNEEKMSVGKATEAYREAGLTLQHFKQEHQDIVDKYKTLLTGGEEKESLKPIIVYYVNHLIPGLEADVASAEADMELAMGAEDDDDMLMENTAAETASGEYSQPSVWVPVDKNFKPKTSKMTHGKKTFFKGGKFVKVKKSCKTFPYCNQGDINSLELTNRAKDITESIHKETGIDKKAIKSLILTHMTEF